MHRKTAVFKERQFNTFFTEWVWFLMPQSVRPINDTFDAGCHGWRMGGWVGGGHLSVSPTEEKSPAAAIRKSRGAFLSLAAPSCPGLSEPCLWKHHWSRMENRLNMGLPLINYLIAIYLLHLKGLVVYMQWTKLLTTLFGSFGCYLWLTLTFAKQMVH